MNGLNTNVHCQLRYLNLHSSTNCSSKWTEQQFYCWVNYYIGCSLFFQDDTSVPECFHLQFSRNPCLWQIWKWLLHVYSCQMSLEMIPVCLLQWTRREETEHQQSWPLFLVSAAWAHHLAFWCLSLAPGMGWQQPAFWVERKYSQKY